MQFEVGEKVKFNKPLHIGYKPAPEAPEGREKDIREGLVGHVVPRRPSMNLKISEFVPVRFPESNNTWYLNPVDLEKVD